MSSAIAIERHEHDLERHQAGGRERKEDHGFRCAVKDVVEPAAGLGREAKLARHAAVHAVQDLSKEHEAEAGADVPGHDGARGGDACDKRRPRHLARRNAEFQMEKAERRPERPSRRSGRAPARVHTRSQP